MNLSAARPSISKTFSGTRVRSGTVYALIIILALVAFETFNYSTTAFSLQDLLGDLRFAGIPWSTFLALAFCGIDFAGIAQLIAPENRKSDMKESWYLFGAWLIAATANAALTWWGVAVAISDHVTKSSSIISTTTLTRTIPLFVAIMVWVIRILIIASLSSALERLSANKRTVDSKPFDTKSFSSEDGFESRNSNRRPVGPITMTRISNPSASGRSTPVNTNVKNNSYVSFKENVNKRSGF